MDILTVVASINKALEIAQSKGAFTLQQAAATYNNLQTLSTYLEKVKQKYDQKQEIQGISHMTQEEAADSEIQEDRGVILNEKEQKEIEKINAIEDLIRQAVETSSEEESDEIIEEQPVEDEEVEEEVEEEVVEEEVEVKETQPFEEECKIEECKIEEVVEEEVVDVSIVANNSPNDNHIVSNLKSKKPIYVFSKKEQERKRQLQKPIYSEDESSDDDETITI